MGSAQRPRKPLSVQAEPPRAWPTTAQPPRRVWPHQDASKARRRGAVGGRYRKADGRGRSVFRVCLRCYNNGDDNEERQGALDRRAPPVQMADTTPGGGDGLWKMWLAGLGDMPLRERRSGRSRAAFRLRGGGARGDAERDISAGGRGDRSPFRPRRREVGIGFLPDRERAVGRQRACYRGCAAHRSGAARQASRAGVGGSRRRGDRSRGAAGGAPVPFWAVHWGDPETMSPGAWVIAVGNPYGLGEQSR